MYLGNYIHKTSGNIDFGIPDEYKPCIQVGALLRVVYNNKEFVGIVGTTKTGGIDTRYISTYGSSLSMIPTNSSVSGFVTWRYKA